MKCSTCNGIGFVSVQQNQTRTVRIYRNASGSQCWQHEAVTSEIETFPTGRMVTVSEICEECHGIGLVADPAHDPDCRLCAGIGTMTVSDGHGGVDFDKCICVNPALIELEVA